jgi:putative transposase
VSAKKSVIQSYMPSEKVLSLMRDYRQMTNDAIRIGLVANVSAMRSLCMLSYKQLKRYKVPSYYRLCAISKAAGILGSRKKSIRRGFKTKDPCLKKLVLVSCYGFKIAKDWKLQIPVGNKKFELIQLTKHTIKTVSESEIEVNSFCLTENTLSLCVSKKVEEMKPAGAFGIDSNLRNLAVGNDEKVTYYDLSKVVEIGEATHSIVRSFKRNDARIRREISSKYGRRKTERVKRILHSISKAVAKEARENNQAIVFEDIRNIRSMYRKGNYQRHHYRRQMNNNWPFAEIRRQIEYKAAWEGVPVIHLTKGETRGTSSLCPRCGERLQSDRAHRRQLWCTKCGRWLDRDLVAVMNISRRGWLRFDQSKGLPCEAMVKEPEKTTAILKVDGSKLASRRG